MTAYFSADTFHASGVFTASGGGYDPVVGWGEATAYGMATFSLSLQEPMAYTISGNLATSDIYGMAEAALSSSDGMLFDFLIINPSCGSLPTSSSGIIGPGGYTFYVQAQSAENYSGQASFATDFVLTAIPEPATLSLLALSGLAILRRRRCRGRHEPQGRRG